jgi:divalent anion:Na+ symporter, DASS family
MHQRETHLVKLLICVIVAAIFWFLPAPAGLSILGVRLLGIFVATILGIILKAMPMGAVALVGLTATIITQTLTFEQAFSGFDNGTVWLIVAAFFIARGFSKTGLGNRIAYLFVRMLGKKTLGLSYGLLATELVLSPAIPSSTARAGGIIFPILNSLSLSFGSDPQQGTARRMGSFLTVVAAQGAAISSALFLTSMAPNPLIASFAAERGVEITWGSWIIASCVPGILALLIMPLVVYKLYPPAVKATPHASEFANEKLKEMGRVSAPEWMMLATFAGLLILWIFGKSFGATAVATALLGLCVLLIVEVLTWKDVLSEHGAWETLFWFAALVAMASNLATFGIIEWVGLQIGGTVEGLSWPVAGVLLVLVYFYLHYLFASQLAHVVSMYPVFLTVMITVGAPPLPSALLLAFCSGLFGALTHYASGPAAILYGPRYVPIGSWWKMSFVVSVVNLFIFIVIGGLWWKLLGLW